MQEAGVSDSNKFSKDWCPHVPDVIGNLPPATRPTGGVFPPPSAATSVTQKSSVDGGKRQHQPLPTPASDFAKWQREQIVQLGRDPFQPAPTSPAGLWVSGVIDEQASRVPENAFKGSFQATGGVRSATQRERSASTSVWEGAPPVGSGAVRVNELAVRRYEARLSQAQQRMAHEQQMDEEWEQVYRCDLDQVVRVQDVNVVPYGRMTARGSHALHDATRFPEDVSGATIGLHIPEPDFHAKPPAPPSRANLWLRRMHPLGRAVMTCLGFRDERDRTATETAMLVGPVVVLLILCGIIMWTETLEDILVKHVHLPWRAQVRTPFEMDTKNPHMTTMGGRSVLLHNDLIQVGVDLQRGGAIVHMSQIGSNTNMLGRVTTNPIMIHLKSGPENYNKMVERCGKNGVFYEIRQVGDKYGNIPQVFDVHHETNSSLSFRLVPLLFGCDRVPARHKVIVNMALNGRGVEVTVKLTNLDVPKIAFGPLEQRVPVLHTNGDLDRLMTYIGERPFTNGMMTEFATGWDMNEERWLPGSLDATESWAALLDKSMRIGVGLYTKNLTSLHAGHGFAQNQVTGYMDASLRLELRQEKEYTIKYSVILGDVNQIRSYVYKEEGHHLVSKEFMHLHASPEDLDHSRKLSLESIQYEQKALDNQRKRNVQFRKPEAPKKGEHPFHREAYMEAAWKDKVSKFNKKLGADQM